MTRPRVLFLCSQPFFQWRGSPIRVRYNLEALSELGYQVDLVTLPFGQTLEISHVSILRVGSLPGIKEIPIGPSLAKLFFDFKMFFRSIRLLRTHDYDLIHGVEDAGFFAGLLARIFKLPFIYEKHSDPASYRKKGIRNLIMAIYSRVEAYSLRRADAVIATGAGLEQRVHDLAPQTPCTHLFDIPSSRKEPQPEDVRSIRETLQSHPKEVLATYVGSFATYQGIDLLFEAAPRALEENPKLRLVIIGGSESEIQERQAYLQGTTVSDRVTFVGKVDPDLLPSYLAASDLLLSPRISGHNTPLKLLDYFKAGGAIVATDMEANRLLLDESTAVFASPTPEGFASALAQLSLDPEKRETLAGKGRSKIDEVYNFENYRNRLGDIYTSLLPSTSS